MDQDGGDGRYLAVLYSTKTGTLQYVSTLAFLRADDFFCVAEHWWTGTVGWVPMWDGLLRPLCASFEIRCSRSLDENATKVTHMAVQRCVVEFGRMEKPRKGGLALSLLRVGPLVFPVFQAFFIDRNVAFPWNRSMEKGAQKWKMFMGPF